MLWRGSAALVSALSVGACSFDWDGYDPRLASGGGAGATTTTTGGAGGAGGAAGAGGEGGSPAGGAGTPIPTLVDRGLLVRYFIDEADAGTGPAALTDAAMPPLDLPIDYGVAGAGGGGGGTPAVVFSESDGHRGLTWSAVNSEGRATIDANGTKIATLAGTTTVTLECVAHLVDAAATCSRLLSVASGGDPGKLALCSNGPSSVVLGFEDVVVEEWSVNLALLGRTVLHAVLDTGNADPEARARLYVDGVDAGAGTLANDPPALGLPIPGFAGNNLTVGNRGANPRSIAGTIFYCAVYAVALTPAEIQQNAAALAASDDR